MSTNIRLLIADDHVLIVDGLRALLGRQPGLEVVGDAYDGETALDLWQQQAPDVSLLDLRMPKLDGIQVLSRIRASNPQAKVIILTTYDEDELIFQAVKAGAKAYLLKDAGRDEIVDCVHRVHAGETCLPPAMATKLAQRIASEPLSKRELEVLTHLAAGQSNREIAETLFITETTVKSHLKRLFPKLGVSSRTEAIGVALQRGLVRL